MIKKLILLLFVLGAAYGAIDTEDRRRSLMNVGVRRMLSQATDTVIDANDQKVMLGIYILDVVEANSAATDYVFYPQGTALFYQRRLDSEQYAAFTATAPIIYDGFGRYSLDTPLAVEYGGTGFETAFTATAPIEYDDLGKYSLDTPLDVEYGGTGLATLTDHGVIIGSGTGDVTISGVGATGTVLAGNTGADPTFQTPTVDVQINIGLYNALPERNNENNFSGGLVDLSIGDTLGTGDDIVISKGTGKIILVVNTSNDAVGDITVTGESIDRNTGASTPGDTDTITLAGNSTDNSTTGGKGSAITEHSFVDAYITSKWFTGSVTLSTTQVDLTDVDVYHVSFEQFNDQPNIVINTFNASILTTHANAEFDAYLFTLHKDAGDKCHLDTESELHVGTDGKTALVDKYWRLRAGAIDEAIDGTTDGFWIEVWYLNNPTYVEDVTIKLWSTQTVDVDLN